MSLLFSLVVSILFGTGAYLMLKRDLLRVAAGVILISQASTLFLMSAGLSRGQAPIYPFPEDAKLSDPLVQAMALTAIVISFGFTALLVSLVHHVFVTHRSLDQDVLAESERELEAELARNQDPF